MRTSRAFIYLATLVSGAAVMAGEITAGRLVAPYYGTSNLVWALVIGAVLGSLALGNIVGGWLSRRFDPRLTAGWLLLGAGAALFLLPIVALPVMRHSLQLFVSGRTGTLVASAVAITGLLGLPMVILGALSPLLIQALVDRANHTGSLAGRLYALSTAGGLIGTYLSGLVLVPVVGTRATFWLCALALALCGTWPLLRLSRLRRWSAASLALVPCVLAGGAGRGTDPGMLYEGETRYNHVRVQQSGGKRRLLLNDGFSTQSVCHLDGTLPLDRVWGWYAAAPAHTRTGRPRRVLLLGLGAGTGASIYRQLYPGATVTGVEIDGELVRLGQRWFGLPAQTRVVVDDARAFLQRDRGRYDVVIVDAFQFPYVPFQLTTREFFLALQTRLARGGAVMLNVGRDGRSHDLVDAVARTAADVFPRVRGADAGRYNTILVATEHGPAQEAGLDALGLPAAARRHLARRRPLRPWSVRSDAPLLTDDHAPVEAITDRIVIRRLLGP